MYEHTCGYCHGAGVAVELRGRDYPAEYIATVVRNGLGAMPAFRPSDFSDSDIAVLAELITSSPKQGSPKAEGAEK
jgi:mono/diheme cytochrome c family protein